MKVQHHCTSKDPRCTDEKCSDCTCVVNPGGGTYCAGAVFLHRCQPT
jgi:hypothetical protein